MSRWKARKVALSTFAPRKLASTVPRSPLPAGTGATLSDSGCLDRLARNVLVRVKGHDGGGRQPVRGLRHVQAPPRSCPHVYASRWRRRRASRLSAGPAWRRPALAAGHLTEPVQTVLRRAATGPRILPLPTPPCSPGLGAAAGAAVQADQAAHSTLAAIEAIRADSGGLACRACKPWPGADKLAVHAWRHSKPWRRLR